MWKLQHVTELSYDKGKLNTTASQTIQISRAPHPSLPGRLPLSGEGDPAGRAGWLAGWLAIWLTGWVTHCAVSGQCQPQPWAGPLAHLLTAALCRRLPIH